MNWTLHSPFAVVITWIILGIIHFVITPLEITIISAIIITAIAAVYGLLPDLDHKMSKITGIFMTIAITILGIGLFDLLIKDLSYIAGVQMTIIGFISLVLTFIVSAGDGIFSHRSVTHCWWCGIIFLIPLVLVGLTQIEFLLSGYLGFWSHLLGDGIPFGISTKSVFRR